MNSNECCGKCKYNRYDKMNEDFYCSCKDSENYECYTSYKDVCECFELKEKYLK